MKSNERQEKYEKLERIYRGKLTKLCKARYGNHQLPDDQNGRTMLAALLRCGLTDESAIEDAPWCDDLAALKRQARRMKWCEVGALIGLTYAERESCKLWLFDPCDASPEEVEKRRREKQKQADSERQKRKRAAERAQREALRTAPSRADVMIRILNTTRGALFTRRPGVNAPQAPLWYQGWLPVSSIIALAAKTRAFCRPDGARLRNLREPVHRVIRQLAGLGVIETKLEASPRGRVLWVRRAAAGSGNLDVFCDGHTVTPDFQGKDVKIQKVA